MLNAVFFKKQAEPDLKEATSTGSRDLHKTEIESTDFIEIFSSLKSLKVSLYFNEIRTIANNSHYLNLLLLKGSTF
jgi:hypothetical protein